MRAPPLALLIALVATVPACDGGHSGARAFPIPGERGAAVTVEVLNASGRTGLARLGTRVLRRSGIDVVYFGNAPAGVSPLDSTRIVLRRGDRASAERVRQALGVGRIVLEPEAALLLDVSVLLGADFSPRLEFHP